MSLFEYALLRVVPRVERGEFINAGVVLYCQDAKFLDARIRLDPERLRALDPNLDPESVQAHLEVASRRPFAAVRDHVLLPFAGSISEADAALTPRLVPEALRAIVDMIPEEWLADEPGFGSIEEVRSAYVAYLSTRLQEPRAWVSALEETRR